MNAKIKQVEWEDSPADLWLVWFTFKIINLLGGIHLLFKNNTRKVRQWYVKFNGVEDRCKYPTRKSKVKMQNVSGEVEPFGLWTVWCLNLDTWGFRCYLKSILRNNFRSFQIIRARSNNDKGLGMIRVQSMVAWPDNKSHKFWRMLKPNSILRKRGIRNEPHRKPD